MRYFVLWLLLATTLLAAAQQSEVPAAAAAGTVTPSTNVAPVSPVSTKIVPGATVYIEKMGGFENYLAAAFGKKKVQLVEVADKSKADYVISGTAEDKKAGWAKIAFTGSIHSDAAASITMIDAKSSAVVFAYAVNKKNTVHGDQTTAEACAKHLQAHIEG